MKTARIAAFAVLVTGLVASSVSPARAAGIGPTPYLSFAADSPFAPLVGSFSYFHFENFEDHLLNVPGVTASPGSFVTSVNPNFTGTIIDSVLEDGGATPCPQGTAPNPCDSYFSGNGALTFTFSAAALGGSLPTHAGLVWTDGAFFTPVTFSAFGPGGVLLGTFVGAGHADGSNFGGTAEDRFYGWTDAGGISSIQISNVPGIEIDHLQYGRLPGATAVPEPATLMLMGSGLGLIARRVRRRR